MAGYDVRVVGEPDWEYFGPGRGGTNDAAERYADDLVAGGREPPFEIEVRVRMASWSMVHRYAVDAKPRVRWLSTSD